MIRQFRQIGKIGKVGTFTCSAWFSENLNSVCIFRTHDHESSMHYVYVGTTDILCSTFSFKSVNIFPISIDPPPPPHPWHLSYVYDIVTFKFECQGWGWWWRGYVTQTAPHHHHPTPSIFLLMCHAVEFFFGRLSFV